jgi:hypothetical protein
MEFTKEQKFYAEIVQKAWDDAEFKKELIANPIAAIEELTGKKLNIPKGKTLVVRDQTDDSIIYINIPAKRNAEDIELNDEQLDAVAGGIIPLGDIKGGKIGGVPPGMVSTEF